MMSWLWIVPAIVISFAAYVRLAPTDPAAWHHLSDPVKLGTREGGVTRSIPGDAKTLIDLDRVILATPRTTVLAGGPEAAITTYVTKSRLWGFPDYSTVALMDDHIVIEARLRFGKSDLGVNARCVNAWLAALAQTGT